MRLEKIEAIGFKSFADKTELNFDFPITAIVGPNGCGKSNVVDAVKWVLGEQSVKSLRSGHMSDVIFSGSTSRKPMSSAEVSLFFSNTSGALPIETDNVQITRRIYRSGECEYLINKKICRLRDIKELFMDTGVGAKAYSIIEQGQIDQLLHASKMDRRIIFEEAAGISKYKAHKKEAQRKLDRTEQNLLRLADILGEVEKQLRSVKYQAGKARNYLKYTERLKELQVNFSLVEYAKFSKTTAEKKEQLADVQQKFSTVAAEVSRNDTLTSELGRQIIETENNINQTDNHLVSVQSKIEQHKQKIEFLKARIEELAERKLNASQRIEKLAQTNNLFVSDIARYKKELIQCDKEYEEKTVQTSEFQQQIDEINRQCTNLEAELQDEKSGIIDIVRRTAQLHNELQSLSDHRDSLSNQRQRLSGRADTAKHELEQLLTEKAQYEQRLLDVEKNLTELDQTLEVQRSKAEKIDEVLQTDTDRLSKVKESRSAITSELNILTDMENRKEGLAGAVRELLSDNAPEYIDALVADIITADVKYACAIEACLEGKTDSVIVNNSIQMIEDTETIEKLDSRVKFICLDRIEQFVDSTDLASYETVKGRLVEFVDYDQKYAPLIWQLLGKVLVVDTLESAIELTTKLGSSYEYVTLDGKMLTKEGGIKLGPLGKATSLISRKSRLKQLQDIIANMESEVTELEQNIQSNNQSKEHLANLRKELRTAIYESNTEKTELNSKLSFFTQSIEKLRQEQPLITGELEMLEEQIAQSVKREYNSQQKLGELEDVNEQRNKHIEELESQFAKKRELLRARSEELTELKVAAGQAKQQSMALTQSISSLEKQMAESIHVEKSATEEIQTCEEQSDQASRDILSSESEISELYIEKEQTQRKSKELHGEIEQLLQNQRQTEELVRQKRAEQSRIEEQVSELKIELGQLEVKLQDLIERVHDELQINLEEAFENYQDQDVDWQSVREEITELRAKIDRLGNVNLDAIDEQETLETRQEFLSTQVEDLNSSKHQLQQLINRLNKTSREKFQQTFEEIRNNFRDVFRKLFGGGKADIVLEEAEDILDAGIEIVAKPPGKETRSISLLSGGEKSMTAIALLFAVFKSKPSPFCFLDEVDAALDEANNERFNMMIKEFQKQSQFIVITHSKRTMSIADQLYGITMQTKGVSKRISVQFDKYEQMQHEEESEAAAVA